MTEQPTRICSTRSTLSEMLEAASRQVDRLLQGAPSGHRGLAQVTLEQAQNAVEDLTARLAAHRRVHGC